MSQNPDMVAVIMAGGAGTRFWPLSTEARPKQFLRLFGERTPLQLSYDRARALVPPEKILILTSQAFLEQVAEQLPELPRENIIGEPKRRDTAAAITLAALLCQRRFGDPVMAIFPADHLIEPLEQFQRTICSAARAAAEDREVLYTVGIQPTYAEIAYGYLERGDHLASDDGIEHYQLEQFHEKPDLPTAQGYLKKGCFFWNGGIFVWATSAILAELQRLLWDHLRLLGAAVQRDGECDWEQALSAGFDPLPKISIDFGVMEKAKQVRCVASPFNWSDVGGWLALEPFLEGDAQGNAHRGRLPTLDAQDNLVFCDDPDDTVALVGVADLVVVRAGGRTLVTQRQRAESVKELVALLDDDLK